MRDNLFFPRLVLMSFVLLFISFNRFLSPILLNI